MKIQPVTISCLLVAISMSGCSTAHQNIPILANQDGFKILKLNIQNGDLWELKNGHFSKMNENSGITLKKGQKYFLESNQSVIYLGDGIFSTPKKDYERLWK